MVPERDMAVPRFTTGGPMSSDSDTERERSASSGRYDGTELHDLESPDDRIGSVETISDPQPIIPYWSAKRHLTCGNLTPPSPNLPKPIPWRGSSPGKLKTAYAVLVLCLNLDVDPPDVVKTNPCAVLECWVDPHSMPAHKALEAIGTNLKHQFEGLSSKLNYKPTLDPSYEDLQRICTSLRKQAKDDAVLFHFNGHGVPKPTSSGELWCFNRTYTQYIPVSLQEVQGWLGSPGVYIWDCSAAGNLLQNFNMFAERRDLETNLRHGGYIDGSQPFMNSLQLAACAANEQLPSCPELPADLFTSCLTSPIDIALRFFTMNHQLPNNITTDMVMQLPGDLKDRRTPLGELNWIFTAITDTIAWTTFSRELFTRLYRCDLLIASLFRNFLLAERIMKNYSCTPHTYPPLPSTNTHPLWASWDLAVDTCLRQLPELLRKPPGFANASPAAVSTTVGLQPGRIGQNSKANAGTDGEKPYTYVPSRFFADQLTAFEVWISRGGSALTKRGPMSLPLPSNGDRYSGSDSIDGGAEHSPTREEGLVPRKPPDQLPIVLQVLLAQHHRLRALILLSQFVDLGPWAVQLVLTVGIFPYITKLLQAAGHDLRPVLIFIWARILAVDPTVQVDLYNTTGYHYFAQVLGADDEGTHVLPNSSEHKAMCAFILAATARDFPHGQKVCFTDKAFHNCFARIDAEDFLLRQWATLCIAQIWAGNDDLKSYGVQYELADLLTGRLDDPSTEVRCALLYALGTLMGASASLTPTDRGGGGTGSQPQLDELAHIKTEVRITMTSTLAIKEDASPMARKELLVVISCLVHEWRGYFVICAWIYWEEDRKWKTSTMGYHHQDQDITNQAIADWLEGFGDNEPLREENRVLLTSFFTILVVLFDLSVDPYQEVATNAQTIVDYIMALLLESPFARLEATSLNIPPASTADQMSPQIAASRSRVTSVQSPSSTYSSSPSQNSIRPGMTRSETMTSTISNGVSNTIRRTSSFANALKSLAGGIAFPSAEDTSLPSPGPTHPPRFEVPDVSRPPSPNLNVAQYASPYPSQSLTSRNSRNTSTFSRPAPDVPQPPTDFLPCDVMEALIEEDMERLRVRRRTGVPRPHHSEVGPGSMHSPSNSTFSLDSNSSVLLGLGTGAGIRHVLPLKSSFFDWCCEYFTEPQMRQAEADEPGSVQYNYQVWRQQRNEQVIAETQTQSEVAQHCRWDRPVVTLQSTGHPLSMAFHAYDQHLVVANESDMISVWDWSHRKRLNYFCNGNPKGTSITGLNIINQDVGGIILTASSDGAIRLYRNYDPIMENGPVQMVSSFRGLSEITQMRQGSGVVVDWRQASGTLLVGGDSRIIRSWDASVETTPVDMTTKSDSPVTAIVSDHGSALTFLASFADGSVKVFDRRVEDECAIVRSYSEHTSWVQNVRWHPTLSGQFLSASLDGQVKLWDLRGSDSAVQTWHLHPNGLSAFDVHDQTGVFAASSSITPAYWRSQRVIVHSLTKTTPLSAFSIPTGLNMYPPRVLPSMYIPRSTSLVFHPTEMLYAVGEPDGSIRITGCKLDTHLT